SRGISAFDEYRRRALFDAGEGESIGADPCWCQVEPVRRDPVARARGESDRPDSRRIGERNLAAIVREAEPVTPGAGLGDGCADGSVRLYPRRLDWRRLADVRERQRAIARDARKETGPDEERLTG